MTTKYELSEKYRVPLVIILAILLGFCAIVAPGLMSASIVLPAPLFPKIQAAVENMPRVSVVFLFLSGAVLGMIEPRKPVLIGVSTVILFPVLAVIEKCMDITSHPGMPWEIMYYGLLGLAGIGGAYLGKELKS